MSRDNRSGEGRVASARRTDGAAPGAFHFDRPVVTHPKWPIWARILVLPVAMIAGQFSPGVWTLIPGLSEFSQRERANLAVQIPLGMLLLATATALSLLVVWLLVRFVDGMRLRDIGLHWDRRTLPTLAIGYAAALVIVVPVGLALQAAGMTRPAVSSGLPLWADFVQSGITLALLFQGFPEELYWRGYGIAVLRDHPVRAVWITAALFGVMHLISAGGQQNTLERVAYLATPFGFALLAGALALVYRSVWPAVGVHAGNHLGNFIIQRLGVGDSPYVWMVVGLIMTIVAVVILQRWAAGRNLSPRPAGA